MQKKYTTHLSLLLMMVLFSATLLAQDLKEQKEKTVVVTIRGKDAQGANITKMVVKKGAEAETFDVEKYVKENSQDIINPVVKIRDRDDFNETKKDNHQRHYSYNYDHKYESNTAKKEKQGFLGVSQNDNDTDDTEGVQVKITRNSGAAKAGLKDNDVLLQLNEKPINTFNDISVFMRTTKPDDKIQVKYTRNGETKSITATIGQPEDAWNTTANQEKDACLGVYTSTSRSKGAVIQDFTPISAAKEVSMQLGDKITAINSIKVNSHQELWDEIAKYKPKQMVWVTYTRENSAPLVITASLKACKPNEEKIIVVPEVKKDAPKVDLSEKGQLRLQNFTTYPNPIQDMVNIQFKGDAVATILSFYDISGKVLYQQTLNDFSGDYNQSFDVSAYAKGIIVVRVLQGEKVFTQKIAVN